jgi:hypothetical protein
MREQVSRWRVTLSVGIALCTGLVAFACCPKPPNAPEPAENCPKGRAPGTERELSACLQNITFDAAYEVSDSQPLTIIDSSGSGGLSCPGDAPGSRLRCAYGPLAKIEPVIGGHLYSDKELMEGRIVAKLWIPGSETKKYPKYNLAPGDSTYWWVQTDSSRQAGSSVFILRSGRVVVPSAPRPLHREPYEEANFKGSGLDYSARKFWRAAARWIWTLIDETAKVKCGSGSCS